MNRTGITYCEKCGLPSTLPSARLNDAGICFYCTKFKGREDLEVRRAEIRDKFESLVASFRTENGSGYDVIVAYSGGKDSTFTLDLLKNEYDLRILALTFDHGFVSPYALENIRRVVESLGIDHISFKPDFELIAKVFRFSIEDEFHPLKALERASSVCNSCMGLVKFITLKTALEKSVPLIAYGWSPGQIPIQSAILKNQPSFVRIAQDFLLGKLINVAGAAIKSFFLAPHQFEQGGFPANVNPLSFLDYNETEIYKRIAALGWKNPKDTDANSTNCLLNGFANQIHCRKHEYHPYAMEMCQLVREGVLSRDEALERMGREPDKTVSEFVRKRLKLGLSDLGKL